MTLGWEGSCRSREFEEAARASPVMWFAYRAICTKAPYDMTRLRVNAQCKLQNFVGFQHVLSIYLWSNSILSNSRKALTPSHACLSMSVLLPVRVPSMNDMAHPRLLHAQRVCSKRLWPSCPMAVSFHRVSRWPPPLLRVDSTT